MIKIDDDEKWEVSDDDPHVALTLQLLLLGQWWSVCMGLFAAWGLFIGRTVPFCMLEPGGGVVLFTMLIQYNKTMEWMW